MSRIQLDPATITKLLQVGRALEVCDEQGKVVGFFSPHQSGEHADPYRPNVSEEELDRRERAKGKRYSTAEVLDHLRRLEGA